MKALESVGVDYTTKTSDDYDIIHINFYGPNSYALAKIAHKKGKKIVYHAHSTEEDLKMVLYLVNKYLLLLKSG